MKETEALQLQAGAQIVISPTGYNVRLIAAAPELLAALKRVKDTGVFLGAIPQEMVDAAIAKAEESK